MSKLTTQDFIKRAVLVHGNKYDYCQSEYSSLKKELKILCPLHGYFYQRASCHLQGCGCKKCSFGKHTKTLEKFIIQASFLHLNKYSYEKTNYVNDETKVEIVCPVHGSYWCTPNNHIGKNRSRGCPKCGRNLSKNEIIWLDSFNNNNIQRQVNIFTQKVRFKVDGFDPNTNTVYEFLGNYWHGNPRMFQPEEINKRNKQTMGHLYNKTMEKIKTLQQAGFNVEYIWESDFII